MRFTSVGPKWRAALRSSLSLSLPPSLSVSISFSLFPLSLLLAHSLAHTLPSLSCLLRYRATPCSSSSVCAFVAISLLVSLSFFGPAAWCGAGRLGRLQECTKCTVLTDARPCSTASTCLLRPFSFASLRPLALPSPLSLAPSIFLALRARFFITFFFDRLLRLRGSLSHILYVALSPPPPPLPLPRTVLRFFTTV